MTGKDIRLSRFRYEGSRQGLIVPIDHGLTVGPLEGIGSSAEIRGWVNHPAICGVIVHKGMAERLAKQGCLGGLGLMIHLNGMSNLSAGADSKERLTSLETAMRLGADGVSFQVNFDGENDAHNLTEMGKIVDEAARYGLPVLAMVYDKVKAEGAVARTRLRHLMRIAVELGCDAIKIAPPAAGLELSDLLAGVTGDIAVYVAGGSVTTEKEVTDLARNVVRAGGTGLCVGRNVFCRENAGEVLSGIKEALVPSVKEVSELPLAGGIVYGFH